MTIDKYFADKMREIVWSKGWGYQAELADKLGVGRATLNNRLKGRRRTTEDQRRDMCQAVGINYDAMVRRYNIENRTNGEKCVRLMFEGIFT